ncbi:MAG: hypothetical protein ACRD63_03480 [Pyrinomonadaceae bacterium]
MLKHTLRVLKITTVIMVVVIAPIYVLAGLTSADGAIPATNKVDVPLGRLTTTKNKDVMLNGNPSASGATVSSGSQLETPGGVVARVKVPEVADLKMEPESKVNFEYTNSTATVTLIKGCITFRSGKACNSAVVLPDGSKVTLRPEETYSNCDQGVAAVPIGGQAGGVTSGNGFFTAGRIALLVAAGGIITGALLAVSNSEPCTRTIAVSNNTPVTIIGGCR